MPAAAITRVHGSCDPHQHSPNFSALLLCSGSLTPKSNRGPLTDRIWMPAAAITSTSPFPFLSHTTPAPNPSPLPHCSCLPSLSLPTWPRPQHFSCPLPPFLSPALLLSPPPIPLSSTSLVPSPHSSLQHFSCPLPPFLSPALLCTPPLLSLPNPFALASSTPCPHSADLKCMAAAAALTSTPQVNGSSGPHQLPPAPPAPACLFACLPYPMPSVPSLPPALCHLKSMAAAALTSCHLHHPPSSASHSPRILCLGLGGGSLPLFLAHALPSAHVDAVEIDPAVIAAAMRHMGFPEWAMRTKTKPFSGSKAEGETEALALGGMPLPEDQAAAAAAAERVLWQGLYGRVAVYNEDAVSFVLRAAERIGRGGGDGESGRRGEGERADAGDREEQQEPYDLVLVDVFDGSDETPPELLDRNSPFLRVLTQVVHPKHGTVVMNVHADVPPPSLWERVTGRFGDGWADESTQRGRRIHKICRAYSSSLLHPAETHTARQSGIGFTTTTPSQGNMTLVVQRGVVLEGGGGNRQAELEGRLKEGAAAVEEEGAVPFTVAPRVVRGLKAELEGRLKEAAAAVEEGGAVPFTVAPRVVRGLKVFPVEWWCC
ncbi:unnamed protein product [Closterium sp. NIES-64]|nr:unnamed protein product [Closterium sp. NIES-64]